VGATLLSPPSATMGCSGTALLLLIIIRPSIPINGEITEKTNDMFIYSQNNAGQNNNIKVLSKYLENMAEFI
jgi:hypothetical protein